MSPSHYAANRFFSVSLSFRRGDDEIARDEITVPADREDEARTQALNMARSLANPGLAVACVGSREIGKGTGK